MALIGLNETSSVENSRVAPTIILLDKAVYVGGDKGIYVIDVSDPENPFVKTP